MAIINALDIIIVLLVLLEVIIDIIIGTIILISLFAVIRKFIIKWKRWHGRLKYDSGGKFKLIINWDVLKPFIIRRGVWSLKRKFRQFYFECMTKEEAFEQLNKIESSPKSYCMSHFIFFPILIHSIYIRDPKGNAVYKMKDSKEIRFERDNFLNCVD